MTRKRVFTCSLSGLKWPELKLSVGRAVCPSETASKLPFPVNCVKPQIRTSAGQMMSVCGLQTHLFLCETDPMFEVPIHFLRWSDIQTRSYYHPRLFVSGLWADSLSVPSSAGLRQLSAAVGRVSGFGIDTVLHCAARASAWMGLLMGRPSSLNGPEQGSAGHGSHTWQDGSPRATPALTKDTLYPRLLQIMLSSRWSSAPLSAFIKRGGWSTHETGLMSS